MQATAARLVPIDGGQSNSAGGGHRSVSAFIAPEPGIGAPKPAATGSKFNVNTAGGTAYVSETMIFVGEKPGAAQSDGSIGRIMTAGLLDDPQITQTGPPVPSPLLRQYLDLAHRAAERHPYVGIVRGVRPPELSIVYRHQELVGEIAESVPAVGYLLEMYQKIAVVTGPSGAGKSSLLNMAASKAAAAWADGAFGRCIPVRVSAAALFEAPRISQALASCVAADFRRLGSTTVFDEEFFSQRPLIDTPWLVLVDGLDEISSRIARQEALDIIASASNDPRYRFVVTTRPLSSDEMLLHPVLGRSTVELLPLSVGQLTELAEAWFAQLCVEDPRESAMKFVAEVSHAQLRDLAGNPLMATMLCQLSGHFHGRPLPTGRSGIYERFINLLTTCQGNLADEFGRLQRIVASHVPTDQAASLVEGLYERRLELLKRLAVARYEGDTRPSLTLLESWTRDLRPKSLHDAKVDVWRELLAEMLRRSGVMAERGTDFVFIHRSIGEYLAADHLTHGAWTNSRTFLRMLGPNGRLRPRSDRYDPRSDTSIARFLVARWVVSKRRMLKVGLHALARTGGAVSAEFIASLVADGIDVMERTIAAARESLSRECENAEHQGDVPEGRVSSPLASAYALAQLRDERGVKSLARFVQHDYFSEAAVEMLGGLAGPESIYTLQRLAVNLDLAPDRRVQCAAQLVSLSDDYAPRLLADLASARGFSAEQQLSALDLLSTYGAQAREHLAYLAGCTDCYFGLRLRSAILLADHGDERSIPHLVALAMEPSRLEHQRRLVISELLRLGDPQDADVLAEYVSNEDLDYGGRVLGIQLLERLGARGLDILAQLGTATHIDRHIKLLISRALLAAGDERSADPLAQLASETAIDGRSRFTAAELLSSIADPRAMGLLQEISDAADTDAQLKYEIALLLMHYDMNLGQEQLAQVSFDTCATPQLRRLAAEVFVRSSGSEGLTLLIEFAQSSGDPTLLSWTLDVIARLSGTTKHALFDRLPAHLALNHARQMIEASQSVQILPKTARLRASAALPVRALPFHPFDTQRAQPMAFYRIPDN